MHISSNYVIVHSIAAQLFLRFNRQKRDVAITTPPSSIHTVKHTYQRWATRPAGQTWVPVTGTTNNNLTEKELTNRENKTNWNVSRYPTPNRFYSTQPNELVTGSPDMTGAQRNNSKEFASNHDHNVSRATATHLPWTTTVNYWTSTVNYWTSITSQNNESSQLSLEDRYVIVIAVLAGILCVTLLGFLAHCNRLRKHRKVINITISHSDII
jgi:hypothetical protein